MSHVLRLKKGLLSLPNVKTVKNINDYKLEMVEQADNSTRNIMNNEQRAADSWQTFVKSVQHNLHNESLTIYHTSDNQENLYQSTSILQGTCVDQNQDILNLFIMLIHAWLIRMTSLRILFSHQLSLYRSLVTPTQ